MLEPDEPRPKPPSLTQVLDRMGIAELEAYIADLRAEIARAEAEIERKRTVHAAAHSVFKL